MSVRGYFDLNQPVSVRRPTRQPPTARDPEDGPGAPFQLTVPWQIATYLVLVASIISSRFLDLYRVGALESFSVDLPYLGFLGISSLLAFPLVYDKARATHDQPLLLKIVMIFSAGMGWEKIVATAMGK